MNIKDLPKDSYTIEEPQTMNINDLPQGSYTAEPAENEFNQAQVGLAHSQGLLDKIQSGLNTIFPAQETGNAIGGLMAKSGLTGLTPEERKNVDTSFSPLKVAGELGQNALTVATVGGAGMEGRLGVQALKSAGMGVGFGLAGEMQQSNPSLGGAASNATIGAVGGVTLPLVGAAMSKVGQFLTDNLPARIARAALNQPKSELMAGKGVENYALQNTKLGTVSSMLRNSTSAVKSLNGQIEAIFSHPDYEGMQIPMTDVMNRIVSNFPNANVGASNIKDMLQQTAPKVAKLLDQDSLSLLEANTLRQGIGQVLNKAFLKLNNPFNKEVAEKGYFALSDALKAIAPESVPIFAKESKEITLRNALNGLSKTKTAKVGLLDLVAGAGGLAANPMVAAGAITAERVARSPAVELGAAKSLKMLGKAAPAFTNAATKGAARVGAFDVMSNLNQPNQNQGNQ